MSTKVPYLKKSGDLGERKVDATNFRRRAKGVVLSHRVSWLRSFQGVFHDEPRRTVCMFPMFHMAPWTLAR